MPSLLLLFLLGTFPAHAQLTIPYSTRARNFDAMGTTVRGDLRTLGMSGATIGLADSFISAQENPAGIAMTLPGADVQVNSNWVRDQLLQGSSETLFSFNAGLAWSGYPWGFSIGFVSPHTEGQNFSQGLGLVTTREFRLGVGRVFFNNRLALGISSAVGQSERILGTQGYASYTFGAGIGALLQLPNHILLGVSGSVPMRYRSDVSVVTTPITQFFQDIVVPARVSAGIGWIPNRFFKMGASLLAFGPSDNAALLRDENQTFVQSWVFQPRLGLSYLWMEYAELRSVVYLGSSFETPRTVGAPPRPHISGGLEIVPWVLILAAGIDVAPGYINYLAGVGVDLVRLSEKLDLIPTRIFPSRGGFFPAPFLGSDDGLPRPLVKNWKQIGPAINAIQVGLEIPMRVGEKAKEVGKDFVETVKGKPQPKDPTVPIPARKRHKRK